jgi:hypothetical protein
MKYYLSKYFQILDIKISIYRFIILFFPDMMKKYQIFLNNILFKKFQFDGGPSKNICTK